MVAGKSTDCFSGEPRSIIGIVQDITGRKKAEETLKSSYSLLRLAGELAKFGGCTVDVSGNIDNPGERIVNWSDAVADIHETPRGYLPTVKEAVGFYASQYRDKIDRIFMSVNRLQALIYLINRFARSVSNHYYSKMRPSDTI